MSQPLLCGVLTLTPTHCGTGQAAGAVDLPIAREAHTRLPVLPASTIKGVVRDWFGQPVDDSPTYKTVKLLFGPRPRKRRSEKGGQVPNSQPDRGKRSEDVEQTVNLQAGNVVFLEGMLLAFPVRSLRGVYRMVTSPMLIQRLRRILLALGARRLDLLTCPVPADDSVLLATGQTGPVSLEDRVFSSSRCRSDGQVDILADVLGRFVSRDDSDDDRRALSQHLVVVSDETLRDLTQRSTSVSARIVLDHDKKISTNLWYEETLPPDTLFALVMADRPGARGDPTDVLRKALQEQQKGDGGQRYDHLGGNVTVGQGLVRWTLDVEVGS